MSRVVTCPQGHQWEETVSGETAAGDAGPVVCPLCGALCSPAARGGLPTVTRPTDVAGRTRPGAEPPALPGYQLLDVLGQGGMGRVYRARDLRLNRLVAVKMILGGAYASPAQLARFQVEAEALASLQHPHVVQIYEVGEHGRSPYLVLEYVEGGSLDGRLGRQPQPPREAAALVEKLARAVHAAHQRGVVHRDLKPANVLLTAAGEPKITDFGLAKRLQAGDDQTHTGVVMGTPSYMAPEQATGQPGAIGPAADIYALGVILYEMLTGRPPFAGQSTLDTLALVRTAEPVGPRRRQPGVPRDLDVICLKCLHKEPAGRYPTAEALADDLRHFLDGHPILARPVGLPERTWKWVRRNPAVTALIVVSVVAAVTLAGLEVRSHFRWRAAADRAEAKFRLARQVVNDMYTQVAEQWLADEPHQDPLQQAFLQKALDLYQEFAREKADDPALRGETALAWFRLGQIHRILGRFDEADDAYGHAARLQQELLATAPADPTRRHDLAETHNWHGELFREGGRAPAEAEEHFRQALALQTELARADPTEVKHRRAAARSHYNLGLVHLTQGQLGAAGEDFDRAVATLTALTRADPAAVELVPELARAHINRGLLHKQRQDFAAAEADYRAAVGLVRPLQDGRSAVHARRDLAVACQNLGNLYWQQGRHGEAVEELLVSRQALDRLARDFPTRPAYRHKLANTANSLGAVLASAGRRLEADAAGRHGLDWAGHLCAAAVLDGRAGDQWRQARSLWDELVRGYPDDANYERHLGLALGNLGWLCSERRDLPAARDYLTQAVRHLEAARAADPQNQYARQDLRNQYQSLAEVLVRLGDHEGAVAAAAALAGVFPERPQDSYYAACFVARSCPLVEEDERRPQTGRGDLLARYQTAAVEHLQRAAAAGIPFARLADERDVFRPLADLPACRDALARLDALAVAAKPR